MIEKYLHDTGKSSERNKILPCRVGIEKSKKCVGKLSVNSSVSV